MYLCYFKTSVEEMGLPNVMTCGLWSPLSLSLTEFPGGVRGMATLGKLLLLHPGVESGWEGNWSSGWNLTPNQANCPSGIKQEWVGGRGISFKVVYLLVFGEASHDSRVHDPIEEHGERVDWEAFITLVLVYHHQDLLVGCGHGFDGILQRTNCSLLRTRLAEEP